MDSSWLIPVLSLPSQLQQEMDRRHAAHCTHDELSQITDKLIVAWYEQQAVIAAAAKHVAHLEAELMQKKSGPTQRGPEECHLQWARELMGHQ